MFDIYRFACAAIVVVLVRAWIFRPRHPLPPGPRRLPLIGSILSFPKARSWLAFSGYKAKYGPVSCVTVMHQTFIILNDRKSVFDLLDRRSSNYSDRPNPTFATMIGATHNLTLLPYDDEWKFERKIVQQAFSSVNAVTRMRRTVEAQVKRLLLQTEKDPSDLLLHLRSIIAAIVMKVTYGYSIKTSGEDPLLEEVEAAMDSFVQSMQPATWAVDFVPALKYIPEWMPGSGFKKTARQWRKQIDEFVERPYRFVKKQMAAGTAAPSYVSTLLEECQGSPTPHEEFAFMRSASTMYGAGSDTSLAILHSFFMAIVCNHEIQKIAQAEIDAVVGPNRLPTISDRPTLPYVEAVYKEALRWHTVVPFGIPHVVQEDDVYNGYFMPKGAVILPNIWMLNHDPDIYPDPLTFNPSRFLGDHPQPDPTDTTFGFGRRVCAGKRLAELTVFTAITMTLATMHAEKARDKNGKEITPRCAPEDATDGLLSHPQPFQCVIRPRSERAAEMIKLAGEEFDFSHNDADAIRNSKFVASPWVLK